MQKNKYELNLQYFAEDKEENSEITSADKDEVVITDEETETQSDNDHKEISEKKENLKENKSKNSNPPESLAFKKIRQLEKEMKELKEARANDLAKAKTEFLKKTLNANDELDYRKKKATYDYYLEEGKSEAEAISLITSEETKIKQKVNLGTTIKPIQTKTYDNIQKEELRKKLRKKGIDAPDL